MKKAFIIITIILLFLLKINFTFAESLDIKAKSYILIDAKSGEVLSEYNSDLKLYPASTTKMMTAILALENSKLNQLMRASQSAVSDIGNDGMNVGILTGEELPMENLLQALLIRSANETANIIAENIASENSDFENMSRQDVLDIRSRFVAMMNKKALELGALNTHFVNPCGVHDPEHYSTARDLSTIARYAMNIPKFREFVQRDSVTLPITNKRNQQVTVASTNKLLGEKSLYFNRVTGIKTGYTSQAGFVLVSSAINNENLELIAVVMGAEEQEDVYSGSKKLLEYGFKNFKYQNVVAKDTELATVNVLDAVDEKPVALVTSKSLDYILPLDANEWNVTSNLNYNLSVEAPINKGDILGTVNYFRNGNLISTIDLLAKNSVEKKTSAKIKDSISSTTSTPLFKRIIKILGIIILSFIILRITLKSISKRRNMRRRYRNRKY